VPCVLSADHSRAHCEGSASSTSLSLYPSTIPNFFFSNHTNNSYITPPSSLILKKENQFSRYCSHFTPYSSSSKAHIEPRHYFCATIFGIDFSFYPPHLTTMTTVSQAHPLPPITTLHSGEQKSVNSSLLPSLSH